MPLRRLGWLAVGGIVVYILGACKRDGDGPPPSHLGDCIDPIPLEGTSILGTESTVPVQQAVSAADPTCLGVPTLGPERIYKVAVPGDGTTQLRVTVTPVETPGPAAFDPVVYLTRACAATPVCVVAEDRRGGGSLEVAEHTNGTGLVEDVFVVVDGYDYQPQGGAYRLALELLPP